MKLRALSRWIVGVPLLLVMVVFALSNTEPVALGLFPLGRLPFEVPLSVVVLVAMGLGFFLGGLRVWLATLRHRRAARRAEEAVRLLEAKNQELKAGTSGSGLTHAGMTSRA
jgi:putative membrane protein